MWATSVTVTSVTVTQDQLVETPHHHDSTLLLFRFSSLPARSPFISNHFFFFFLRSITFHSSALTSHELWWPNCTKRTTNKTTWSRPQRCHLTRKCCISSSDCWKWTQGHGKQTCVFISTVPSGLARADCLAGNTWTCDPEPPSHPACSVLQDRTWWTWVIYSTYFSS